MKENKFGVGDFVVFDTWEDSRYGHNCLRCSKKSRYRQCRVTESAPLRFYNLMDLDADPRISAGHYLIPERCLTLMVNPPID